MLVDRSCRQGAAVTASTVEIESADGMPADNAFEGDAAVHRVGGVVAHNSIVVFLSVTHLGNRCTPFE